MTGIELQASWRKYWRTRCPRLREKLIHQYAILARRAVDRLQITPWGCVNKDDLLGHAILGLIEALDRYDPDYGIPFEGYAMRRIRGAVLDALRQLDWVPRSVRAEEARLRQVLSRLENRLGRTPSDDEVAAELGVSRDELDELVAEISRNTIWSLDDLVAGMEDRGAGAVEAVGSEADPREQNERASARQRLADAIHALPEREKLVVSLYYYRELTLKEIGQILGVTEQRVSQLHTKALLRLSNKLLRHSELMAALVA